MKKTWFSIIKANGTAVPNAAITIYDAGTTDKRTLYSDTGITEKDNPFLSDDYGRVEFFCPDGIVDIKVSGDSISTYTLENITICDAYNGKSLEIQEITVTTVAQRVTFSNWVKNIIFYNISTTMAEIINILDAEGATVGFPIIPLASPLVLNISGLKDAGNLWVKSLAGTPTLTIVGFY